GFSLAVGLLSFPLATLRARSEVSEHIDLAGVVDQARSQTIHEAFLKSGEDIGAMRTFLRDGIVLYERNAPHVAQRLQQELETKSPDHADVCLDTPRLYFAALLSR